MLKSASDNAPMQSWSWTSNGTLRKPNPTWKSTALISSRQWTVFGDPLEVTIPDPDHSEGEFHCLSLGRSSAGAVAGGGVS